MSVGTSLRRLGEFLEECERTDAASVRESSVTVTDSGASADVEFALSSDADGDIPVRIRGASLDSDGSIGLTLGVDDVLPSDREHVAVDAADVSLDGDPAVVVTVATDAPTTSSTETADDDADSEPPEAVRNPNVPAFEDTTYLEAVYARYETFERMADAFEMDVTDETVRRYMIDQGVHEPSSYETSLAGDPTGVERPPAPAADGDGSPEALADGIGLPESVTIDQTRRRRQRRQDRLRVRQGARPRTHGRARPAPRPRPARIRDGPTHDRRRPRRESGRRRGAHPAIGRRDVADASSVSVSRFAERTSTRSSFKPRPAASHTSYQIERHSRFGCENGRNRGTGR
ncbi:hypothetical protein D320_13624 [Haloferax sp. BAB-2207]|nr:hypothetical protein [Haloferax sp. BAB-2207]ELK52578.1 hypothetical protein D320_13624 [Haloferax sp. BAB-2207]